ncbi:hypothetical protein GJ496_007230 [Pomphorhynchus laevis]|nr:hypothetical protein GJ496_007230 [Pomphorhynchus laevis]
MVKIDESNRHSSGSLKVIPNDKIAQLLQCPICQDVYKDPRALPCLHSYCLECIEPMYVPGKPFSCPYCRQEFLFVSPLKEVLPCDLKMKALLETKPIEFNTTRLCTSCSTHPAIGVCAHCSKYTCVDCIEKHEKILRTELQQIKDLLYKNICQFEDESKISWLSLCSGMELER